MYSEAERSQQREVKKTTGKTDEGTVTETDSKIARTRLGHVRAVFVAVFVAIVGRVLVVRHFPSWPSTGTLTNGVDTMLFYPLFWSSPPEQTCSLFSRILINVLVRIANQTRTIRL